MDVRLSGKNEKFLAITSTKFIYFRQFPRIFNDFFLLFLFLRFFLYSQKIKDESENEARKCKQKYSLQKKFLQTYFILITFLGNFTTNESKKNNNRRLNR